MSVKETVRKQYQNLVRQAQKSLQSLPIPPEGWLATMRKALGMSGPQLGRRLGVGRAAIAQAEKAERHGGVTLKHMDKTAKAMGCKFVYAIVPETSIEEIVQAQATKKATALVRKAGGHMALEQQSLSQEEREAEIKRLAEALAREMPRRFWEDA